MIYKTKDFCVGQDVVLISNKGMGADVGAKAVVKRITSNFIIVCWYPHKRNGQMNGDYYPYQFKPIIQTGEQLEFSFMND